MTSLEVLGWGAVCPHGVGADALAGALARSAAEPDTGGDMRSLYAEPMPSPPGKALVNFDVRGLLGRKGTAFLDRRSALALVACREALERSGIEISDQNRNRAGIVLGTTWGSFKSMSDYTRDTLIENPPYLVSAALFPNTVMNCAAGQAAIWYGLKGVNATIAGGPLAFLNVLRYARNALRSKRAEILLVGAIEEFTPHVAWATHLAKPAGAAVPAGEGAAIYVIRAAGCRTAAEGCQNAEVLSVVTGFGPRREDGRGIGGALERCIRRAMNEADIRPEDVSLVAGSEVGGAEGDELEDEAVASVFGGGLEKISVRAALGECYAVSGAFQLAAVLTRRRGEPKPKRGISVLTGWTRDGGAGAAIVRS
jgi:3-oxoacyl-[acyl-carrier-protein] synthase II